MRKILLPIVILVPVMLQAQLPFFLEQGKIAYENNHYREALYYFNRLVATDSSRGEVFKWRGNCYLEVNQLDSALSDYKKALRLAPELTEVYFNMGIAYSQKKMHRESESFVRKYLNIHPEEPDALMFYAQLIGSSRPDSSLYYMEKAYQLEPNEIRINDGLASEYLNQHKYHQAYDLLKKARASFPHHFELMMYHAYSAFATGKFDECIQLTDSLHSTQPDISFKALKMKAAIMAKTPAGNFQQEGFSVQFPHISSSKTSTLDQWIRDPSHSYYYKTLLDRFRKNETLALDEYFMVYYGFTSDHRYAPYSAKQHTIQKSFNDDDFLSGGKEAKELLVRDEFNPRLLEYLLVSERETGQNYDESLKKYLGIMEGILASGEGTSFETAMIVTAPVHEYDVLGYLGVNSTGQSLIHHEQHIFDVLSLSLAEGDEKKKIYFNIDKPFGSLSHSFNSKETGSKKKKKKK